MTSRLRSFVRAACAVQIAVAMVAEARAQVPPLNPTSNTTITTGGVLHYSSIHIPAGVVVQFAGTAPAIVRCDGDAVIDGGMSVSAAGSYPGGPGAVTLGAGSSGSGCTTLSGGFHYPAGNGVHRGAYGTVIPFSLEGGSPGGSFVTYVDRWIWGPGGLTLVPCADRGGVSPGGGGGGTLVLLVAGRIVVNGSVTAWGGFSLSAGFGSAGSILLRGLGGVSVAAGGVVDAASFVGGSGQGYVRIDSYGASPFVAQGTVSPAPTLVELPYLETAGDPQIGTTWSFDLFGPPGDLAIVALSLGPANAPTPVGQLRIDLGLAVSLGLFPIPTSGHDPFVTITLPIPNDPSFGGLQFFAQAHNYVTALTPRLSNVLTPVIQ
jgi:hypothetical protein